MEEKNFTDTVLPENKCNITSVNAVLPADDFAISSMAMLVLIHNFGLKPCRQISFGWYDKNTLSRISGFLDINLVLNTLSIDVTLITST